MSLRPRYSLLTLLVLTALVAGGVKLWYGPHHVVEPRESGGETVYSYTRDWRGNKIIQGPYIARIHHADRTMFRLTAVYFRDGIPLNWRIEGQFHTEAPSLAPEFSKVKSPLQDDDARELKQAYERAKQKLPPLPQGMIFFEFEGPNEW